MDTKMGSDSRRGITNKFALYHVGLYPSVQDPDEEIHARLRKDWIPIFDEYVICPCIVYPFDRYQVKVAFENHDQSFKRTKPMFNNAAVVETNTTQFKGLPTNRPFLHIGTLYMGDGAFGVSSSTDDVEVADRDYYLEKVEFRSYVFLTAPD